MIREEQGTKYVLVSQHGQFIPESHKIEVDGSDYYVVGGRPPHKPGSTGRVYCKKIVDDAEREWFPNVIDAKWMPLNEYHTKLTLEYQQWCRISGYPQVSADEQRPRTPADHIWLACFDIRWDAE